MQAQTAEARVLRREDEDELLRIITKAQQALKLPDAQTILNTDFELEKFDHIWRSLNDCISSNEETRRRMMNREQEIKNRLNDLVEEEQNLRKTLKTFQPYTPPVAKRYKIVTLLSLFEPIPLCALLMCLRHPPLRSRKM